MSTYNFALNGEILKFVNMYDKIVSKILHEYLRNGQQWQYSHLFVICSAWYLVFTLAMIHLLLFKGLFEVLFKSFFKPTKILVFSKKLASNFYVVGKFLCPLSKSLETSMWLVWCSRSPHKFNHFKLRNFSLDFISYFC